MCINMLHVSLIITYLKSINIKYNIHIYTIYANTVDHPPATNTTNTGHKLIHRSNNNPNFIHNLTILFIQYCHLSQ